MSKKKAKKCPECPAGEKWAVPTADFFSLLLALFIALYALASVNKEKVRALKEEFVKIYDYAPAPEEISPVLPMNPESTDKSEKSSSGKMPVSSGGALLDTTPTMGDGSTVASSSESDEQDAQNVSVGEGALDQTMDGVLLKLPATIPFRGSNASIDDQEMHLFVKRVADIINTLPPTVDISVRGYTDNLVLPRGSQFRDNLDLSSARAATVVRELIQNGVAADRLSSAGFGAGKPLAANTSEANRAKNRRVEFYMFVSNDKKLDQQKQKSVLDSLAKLPQK
ncbi:MAG TPA: flagellar motor protein MotB [Sulfuricurvum sp.]|nr:MAG: flagellar motor protein MotB [Campylobacterales bacterium 16-40-21]OZA01957.1 MAG: flagellar motor protein MotB [Sulfuricurvum sp. 17-40-25]HQS67842.1 flagellar motor protein MotB [Sulfuricurvum sp.]HQT36599.1 flagellar motor protein MotB [Sulfuricurvum sp.]